MKKILMSIGSLAMACGLAFGITACAGTDSINVYNRESGSGTRDAFLELLEIEDTDLVSAGAGLNTTGAVLNAVIDDPNGIGYISLGSLDDTVKAVTIDGVEATPANVINKTYSVWRPFEMIYLTANREENDLLNDFLTYLESADAQEVLEEYGYVSTATNAPAYEAPESLTTTSLNIGGSTSVQELMSVDKPDEGKTCLITAYKEACGLDVAITYDGTGSGTGRQNAANGTYDIGFASAEVTEADMEAEEPIGDFEIYQLCADGIAIIVNNSNTIENLTTEQLRNIYTGVVTSWSELA